MLANRLILTLFLIGGARSRDVSFDAITQQLWGDFLGALAVGFPPSPTERLQLIEQSHLSSRKDI